MNKSKSSTNRTTSFILVAGLLFFLSANASSQMKYNIKLNLNGNQLLTGCCKNGSVNYIPLEELAKCIDPAVKITGPYELGSYFKIEGTKLSAVKTGSGTNAKLKINKTGLISSGVVEIIIDGGAKHTFIEIESFVAALGGTWTYNEATGVLEVTAGGCGTCIIIQGG
jgi:hypothetical protein